MHSPQCLVIDCNKICSSRLINTSALLHTPRKEGAQEQEQEQERKAAISKHLAILTHGE